MPQVNQVSLSSARMKCLKWTKCHFILVMPGLLSSTQASSNPPKRVFLARYYSPQAASSSPTSPRHKILLKGWIGTSGGFLYM